MADTADLKHMIMSFRVSELQVLLGFAGRNKSGRKQELLQRALQLVQKGCTMPVQIKIRELYRQIFSSNLHRRRYPGGPGTSPPQARPPTEAPPSSTALSSCYGSFTSDPSGPLDFSNKHLPTSHPDPPPSGLPVHPDVRFKHLPFYDVLGELMKPTSLVPKNNGRFQESYFVFHLTPQQAQDIAMSRDFRPGAKCEYTVQVQLRFCLLETSCEQDDNFPPSICVRVNGKMAPLPNPIPTSKPGIEPKRPGRPVDITSICRLSPTVSNQLDVSWASEFGRMIYHKGKPIVARPLDITSLSTKTALVGQELHLSWSVENESGVGYCLAIYLVRRLTSDILLQRLKQFGNRHPDHTRALIKEKLAHDPESEIATTSLRVSLICPLGKMRMQIPCRSSTCTHLQCFDATTFLMMNEKKPTWVCPVCDKPAPFDKLLIDGYFVEIFRKSPEGSEIQFHEDGSWSPMKQSKETHVISSPSVKPPSTASASASASSSTSSGKQSGSSKKSVDVIDLTLESSEDEDTSPPASVSSSRPSEQGCVSPSVINLDTPTPPHASSSHSVSSSPSGVALSTTQSNPLSPSPRPSPSPSSVASFSSVESPSASSMSFMPSVPPLPTSSSMMPVPPSILPPPVSIPSSSISAPALSLASMPPTSLPPAPLPASSLPQTRPPPSLIPISQPGPSTNNYGTLNLDALSDREFEEFLQGLSCSQRTPPASPVRSNISTPNSLGSPVSVTSPCRRESPCALRSPRTPTSPNIDSYYRHRSPGSVSSPNNNGSNGFGSPGLSSPNHIGSPSPFASPSLSDFMMRSPSCGMSKSEGRLHSPSHFPLKYEFPLNMYSPCKREPSTRLASPPAKRKSPAPRTVPSYPLTSKMYPPYAFPLPSMVSSPFNMMSGVPSILMSPTAQRSPTVSLTSSSSHNGVTNSHHAYSVPSFDDDLLPILSPSDEIPDFLTQSTSMLGFQPSSSSSSSQHSFNLHSDLIPLE